MSLLQVLRRELKLPLAISTAVHGLALGLLPVQGLPPPASPPPLEVRLRVPAAPDRAAPPAKRGADQRFVVAAAAPLSSGNRAGPELAEPMPMQSSPRAETHAPPVSGLRSATTFATAMASAQRSKVGLADAFGAPSAVAEPARAAPLPIGHAPRHATVSAPIVMPGAAGETRTRADAEPSVEAKAESGLAQRAPPTHALPDLAEGARHAQANTRDKTAWQAAQPTWAQGAALPASPPQPEVAAAASGGESRPRLAEPILAPEPLRVASAVALSLLEAEDAPSNAIAIARLTEASRACFVAPPAHWNAQGRVLLRIRVDATGHPVEVALDSGSGEPRLGRLALTQARDCARFEILDRQGRPRAAVVRLPVVYRFSD